MMLGFLAELGRVCQCSPGWKVFRRSFGFLCDFDLNSAHLLNSIKTANPSG